MTPLIQRMSRLLPYPGDNAHWFDLGELSGDVETFDFNDERLFRMPFQRTMIVVGQPGAESDLAVLVLSADNSITIAPTFAPKIDGATRAVFGLGPFVAFRTPEGLRLHRADSIPRETVHLCLAAIYTLVTGLDGAEIEAHASEPDRGYTSKRRMANGKPPLRYSWRTVTVGGPKSEHRDALGGTHASPRAHTRRGHWRNLRTGKRVWVRDCKVGDAALGSVFHDYKVEREEVTG